MYDIPSPLVNTKVIPLLYAEIEPSKDKIDLIIRKIAQLKKGEMK
jgi:hypothetical protein